ncbi:hypothetical protein DPPLL_08510 [Desulfofustis limnaeus]|jgi:Fe-S-cluster containining protein|uniref:YkgJ family cysteine cluster protein n=2 Tax=Desulfofustis limnaeus TaxID=2740163 RepID=A0ABN6M0Q8_9BACT|nr:YkgJ family cysteine cluster protein [Desulfofustis sp.]BDD86486.1 hypothetical protein DPPLL_08510 [Desulfofustis limnaeus]
MLPDLVVRVLEVYAQADQAVHRYRTATGLRCPSGCVSCCHSPKVEATTLELIPLAFHLFRSNQAELLLKRIDKQHQAEHCILFRPDLAPEFGGGCSHYPYRALVCRLFGFAGAEDREGTPRLAHCRVMKEMYHLGPGPTDETAPLPLFHTFGVAITALHPHLGAVRRPINQAIAEALQKVGLYLDLCPPDDHDHSRDLPPEKPLGTPFRPRRAA